MNKQDIKCGAAFWIQSGSVKHLHIACNDMCSQNKVLFACVTSWRDVGSDDTCRIGRGDRYQPIKHDSYIAYEYSIIMDLAEINAGILQDDVAPIKQMPNKHLLDRIIAGITKSEETPPYCLNYFINL